MAAVHINHTNGMSSEVDNFRISSPSDVLCIQLPLTYTAGKESTSYDHRPTTVLLSALTCDRVPESLIIGQGFYYQGCLRIFRGKIKLFGRLKS